VCDVMTEQSWIRNGHHHLSKQGEFPALACSSTSEDLGKDGKIHIDTSFSRLLGKPPVMVTGMTPATVKRALSLPSSTRGTTLNLLGGGHYSPAALRAKVAEIQSRISPGIGLTFNSLYINPRQFSLQLPLWQEMRREGLPMEGFCSR
jgi:fatty acid synthase subunit alpha, fungi type